MADDLSDRSVADCNKSAKEIDAVILQVVVEDQKLPISRGLEDFEYNPEDKNDQHNSISEIEINELNGQRKSSEIKIEQYVSQGSVSSSLASDDIPLKELPDKIPYFSGIPAVEVIRGIIHLYRDRSKPINERASSVVCILGIPAHIALSDLLKFLGPVQESVKNLQVVRDSTPNQYMVILKFKAKTSAEMFYVNYNMKRYSSFEKRVCQLVYASRIEILKANNHKLKPLLPGSGITEVPSCSICLERLDDTVLKILCNHSFHIDCLIQWEDATCPVCRYTQIPEISGENTCSTCDSKEDLWICLICGHVGCGRYLGGHAHEHFSSTQHTFSLQVGTQRVWDYIGDNYVHRLVQNKTDGKLIEIQGNNTNLVDEEKVDSLQLEYTYLLTSQLDSQRIYFEEKLERAEKNTTEQIDLLKKRLKMLADENEKLTSTISSFDKEKKEKDRKISQLQTKVTKLQGELKEEQELNKCLSGNQKGWKDRVTLLEEEKTLLIRRKDQEILDLKEQVKDLMFYMETQQKISEAPADMKKELQDGQVIMSKSHEGGGARKPKRKGRHS